MDLQKNPARETEGKHTRPSRDDEQEEEQGKEENSMEQRDMKSKDKHVVKPKKDEKPSLGSHNVLQFRHCAHLRRTGGHVRPGHRPRANRCSLSIAIYLEPNSSILPFVPGKCLGGTIYIYIGLLSGIFCTM